MDYDINLIYEGHAQLHGRQSLYILGLQSAMGRQSLYILGLQSAMVR